MAKYKDVIKKISYRIKQPIPTKNFNIDDVCRAIRWGFDVYIIQEVETSDVSFLYAYLLQNAWIQENICGELENSCFVVQSENRKKVKVNLDCTQKNIEEIKDFEHSAIYRFHGQQQLIDHEKERR